MRSHLKTTTEAQQKYTRAHCVQKTNKQKHTKKQRESKPKLIVDEKGVILLFLEPPSPNKNQNKTPSTILWVTTMRSGIHYL